MPLLNALLAHPTSAMGQRPLFEVAPNSNTAPTPGAAAVAERAANAAAAQAGGMDVGNVSRSAPPAPPGNPNISVLSAPPPSVNLSTGDVDWGRGGQSDSGSADTGGGGTDAGGGGADTGGGADSGGGGGADSGGGGFKRGGVVKSKRRVTVGEEGPEAIVPLKDKKATHEAIQALRDARKARRGDRD